MSLGVGEIGDGGTDVAVTPVGFKALGGVAESGRAVDVDRPQPTRSESSVMATRYLVIRL